MRIRRTLGLVLAVVMLSAAADAPNTAAQSGGVLVPTVQSPWPGKIFVSHDEWVLGDFAFSVAPDTRQLALNVASWFTGGRPGRFLVHTANFGLNQPALADAMRSAGHTWVTGTTVAFTVDTLLQYDAVFLAHDAVDTSVLIDYVRAGGNVYLAGGTGPWSVGEAANWNPFLNAFGLGFEDFYNMRLDGVRPMVTSSPLFAGVSALYDRFGSPIVKLDAADPNAQILVTQDGRGLFAAYQATVIPVAVEICPSRFDLGRHDTIAASIAGTADFDIRKVEPASVRVVGVAPSSNSQAYKATPSAGRKLAKTSVGECKTFSDNRLDLVLWLDSADLIDSAEMILGQDLEDGDTVALTLTGRLKAQYGGTPIVGESLVRINRPNSGLLGLGILGLL